MPAILVHEVPSSQRLIRPQRPRVTVALPVRYVRRTPAHPRSDMTIREEGPEAGFEPRIGRSVSLDHAAQMLGVSRRTIYNRIREGRLQTIRTLGGSQRVLID